MLRILRRSLLPGLTLALLLACAGQRTGATTPQPTPTTDDAPIEPIVDEILHAMSDYLASATTFSVEASIAFDEVLPDGQKLQFTARDRILVRRPDRLRVDYEGDLSAMRYFYDGRTATLLDTRERLYASFDAPADIDAAVDASIERFDAAFPLSPVVRRDPYAWITAHATSGFYVGRHDVNGTPCHHLAFRRSETDLQLWIEDGPMVVPHKAVITYRELPGAPQFVATFSAWNFTPRLADETFNFRPGIGHDRVEILDVDTPVDFEDAPEEGASP